VEPQLDTLITALYVQIDDLFALLGVRQGPGRPPRLTDSELVCLAVAQVVLGCNSERRWLRFAVGRLGHLFPYLPTQPNYNRRLRAAYRFVEHAMRHLAGLAPSWCDQLRLLDSTPVPCGTSRETAKRSQLADWANYGYCASHSRFFWGLRLHLLTTPDGAVVAWCLADPKIGDREVAQAMLERCPTRPGLLIVADKGYAGREFEDFVREIGATLVRPDRRNERRRHGSLGWIRQRIESVNDTLKDQLGLEKHGGRTRVGVTVRVAQRLRPHCRRLAQLAHRRPRQALPGRLRPLSIPHQSSSRATIALALRWRPIQEVGSTGLRW
jgi:Transposase DDE domain